jgi:hypothetical protein
VLEGGTESRFCVLPRLGIWPRKWRGGIHSATVTRDNSRKEPHDGLSDTLVFPKREQSACMAIHLPTPTSL